MSQSSRVVSSLACSILAIALVSLLCLTPCLPMSAMAKDRPATKKAAQSTPGQVGSWSLGFNTAPTVHLHVLPNGKVLSWSEFPPAQPPPAIQTYVRIWDPATNVLTTITNNDVDLFCSGHSILPDGRVLITSGTVFQGGVYDGTATTVIFDSTTNSWTNGPAMNNGRWYPTNVALGNGEALVVSGSYKIGSQVYFNNTPQVWQTNGSWRTLSTATHPNLDIYAWTHLRSNGAVFYSGPLQQTGYFTTSGTGSWSLGPQNIFGWRDSGSSVMYDVDKVMVVGGGDPPKQTAEVIDLSQTTLQWSQVASMSIARRHLNTTILPDGKVLVTGGTSGSGFNDACNPVYSAEIWNPTANTWTTMASMTYPRIYHSATVLLPDARVLVGGTTETAATATCPAHANVYQTEIFSPPYLFTSTGSLAARPFISAPSEMTYGQNYYVGVSGKGGSNISKITLVRLSSTTHSFNQNQRFHNLSFSYTLGGYTVTMPSNSNALPPGHYMLFVINSAGVPSVAQIVHVS